MLGHCDIVWNEWADAAANDGCALYQDSVEYLRSSVRVWLKTGLREKLVA